MLTTTEHPTLQELQDFALGRLTGSRRQAVEAHVADCDQCCQQLRSVPNDTFADHFKRGNSSDSQQATRLMPEVVEDVFQTTLPLELQNHSRYRIVKEVGRGGMGVVYLAEHTFMERQVALKVITKNLVSNSRAVDRFRQEVKAAAKLSHANIVTAHDAEEAGGLHFLVMEYVEGINLAMLVQKRGPLSAAQACNVMKQVARGLQHAHEKGMVHRDIKPQNLLITKKGLIKVLDFGLAKLLHATDEEALTDAEMVLGTPDYIAPEQAYNSQKADIRSDIYSLGCTFYFLLTGHPPFPKGTALDKMVLHTETMPAPVHQLRPTVPQAVSDIVAKMMAKKPAHRFQTPAALLQALTELPTELEEAIPVLEVVEAVPAADTEPIAQAPTLVDAPCKRRLKKKKVRRRNRRPYWIAGLVVASLLLLGGGAWGLVSALKDDYNPTKETNPNTTPLAKNNNPGTPNSPKEKTFGGFVKGKNKQGMPGAMTPRPVVVLMIPSNDFWYDDYYRTRAALNALNAEVKVISTRTGKAVPQQGSGGEEVPIFGTIDQANLMPIQYDALLVLGGNGVNTELRLSEPAKQLITKAYKAGKVVGSQCMGAALLADADIFEQGQPVACPPFPWVREAVVNKGATVSPKSVEVKGKVVTAKRPEDSRAFVEAVMELLRR